MFIIKYVSKLKKIMELLKPKQETKLAKENFELIPEKQQEILDLLKLLDVDNLSTFPKHILKDLNLKKLRHFYINVYVNKIGSSKKRKTQNKIFDELHKEIKVNIEDLADRITSSKDEEEYKMWRNLLFYRSLQQVWLQEAKKITLKIENF